MLRINSFSRTQQQTILIYLDIAGVNGFRWLKTVYSTFQDLGHNCHSLSIDATVIVSKNCPVTGDHVGIIFFNIKFSKI